MKKGDFMLGDFIKYIFFTNRCKYCETLINFGEELCEECKEIPRIQGEKCKYCGCGKDRCDCKNAKLRYDGISAPFYYENRMVDSIANFKFDKIEYIGTWLAKDMAEALKQDFESIKFDFICFVPFSFAQLDEREYNCAEVLAYSLSKELKIPVNDVLVKTFNTESQHNAKRIYRSGNPAGAYSIKYDVDITDKTVLLVDDIKTTGATLNECVRVLRFAGAKEVYCSVAAITPSKRTKKA